MSDHPKSWSDTRSRQSIIDFVKEVTDPGSQSHVPEQDRIAVFDNDGTLWCGKPAVQGVFIVQHLGETVREDPTLREIQPWKTVVEGNHSWIDDAVVKHYGGDDSDVKSLMAAVGRAFGEVSVEEFAFSAGHFLESAKHPLYQRP